jgi:hypothetical protein
MQQHPDLSVTILKTATERGPEKSTCPSEIARMLFPDDWRKHMTEVVDVAIDLHHQGKVMITQKGVAIDVKHIKGPIRIKIS